MAQQPVDREIVVSTSGKVPFDFHVNTSACSRPSVVEPTPRRGVVGPGSSVAVRLRVLAGVPEKLLETVMVELAHFDPIPVQVRMFARAHGTGRAGKGRAGLKGFRV